MPEPLTLQLEQSRRYLPGDYAQVEVDGEVQSDAFVIWGSERAALGMGHGPFGRGRFGYGRSLGLGRGAFARGIFGQGVRIISLQTRQRFVEGEYEIRLRVRDRLGNVGDWSEPATLAHNPVPPPPRNLRIAGDSLLFDWSP